jgi:hypothetical protein
MEQAMKFEQFIVAVVIGLLLWAWAGDLVVDCSRVRCYNTVSYNED